MANYKTSMWTGVDGLRLTGVFPTLAGASNAATLEFGAEEIDSVANAGVGALHSITTMEDARTDARSFLWGVLEQFHVAYTGGRNAGVTEGGVGGNGALPTTTTAASLKSSTDWKSTGTGEGKTTKMTVTKSSLSLIDEDTAKTTYTVVFNYAVGAPGGDTLEIEEE